MAALFPSLKGNGYLLTAVSHRNEGYERLPKNKIQPLGLFLFIILAFPLALCLLPASSLASESRIAYAPNGQSFFELIFFDQGEQFYDFEDANMPGHSTWTLSAAQKESTVQAAALWAEILGPGSRNSFSIPVNVGTYNIQNADALSWASENDAGESGYTGVAEGVILGQAPQLPAQIRAGLLDFGIPSHLHPLPLTGKADMTIILFHELGHALGITPFVGLAPDNSTDDSDENIGLSLFGERLEDQYGTSLADAEEIKKASDRTAIPGLDFIVGDLSDSGVTFYGPNVAEVLGPDEGINIEGYEGDSVDLAHLELERSLMSHQEYRNYSSFMEAELAVLQDIGYSIDRRNFFGSSIYGDNMVVDNYNGYFARNAEGTAYITGQPNRATLGVGLHIYGKGNTVTQYANLLAGGVAGTGIRVDGSNNELNIAAGSKVATDGAYGTGLLVSYGKDHEISSSGEVTALGPGGVAARFDFGHNVMGDDKEYRGSYIYSYGNTLKADMSSNKDRDGFDLNLDGPLVKEFNVSGRLEGTAASIYISENAFVETINILPGAQVTGDIISLWDPNNARVQQSGLISNLNFDLADSYMALRGNIQGEKGLNVNVSSGQADIYGQIEANELNNEAHLALLSLNPSGGPAATVTDFTNTSGATLETAFNASGQVAGINVSGSAAIDGDWALSPTPDFYPNTAEISPGAAVSGGSVNGSFSSVKLGRNTSPTLNFEIVDATSGSPKIGVSRPAEAYSQYAADPGEAELGRSLHQIAGQAEGEMRQLLTALDFTAPDGSGVRQGLSQLSPEPYEAAARSSLRQQQRFNIMLLRRMLAEEENRSLRSGQAAASGGDKTSSPWRSWISPFLSVANQSDHGSTAGFDTAGVGLMAGMERQVLDSAGEDTGLSLGWHLALTEQRTDLDGLHEARASSFGAYLGLQSLYRPHHLDGLYFIGQARLGLEDSQMRRQVNINGYNNLNKSQWTDFTASTSLGGGKDWRWDNFKAGPLFWLEYSALRRPDLEEEGGASRLGLENKYYDSLSSALGAHWGGAFQLTEELNLKLDLLAAWRHEYMDSTFKTRAFFPGYGYAGFSGHTELANRDSLLLQGGVRVEHSDNVHAQVELGGELAGASSSFNVGLSFGWEF